jgi:hypothetical protein
MNFIKRISKVLASAAVMGFVFVPGTALAQGPNADAICKGLAITGGNCQDQPGQTTVNSAVKTAINILSLVVGIIAVIMIIIGGLKYIMSSGDSSNINSAKNTILYALIGLVVVALAQVLVRFVVTKVK